MDFHKKKLFNLPLKLFNVSSKETEHKHAERAVNHKIRHNWFVSVLGHIMCSSFYTISRE